jgi:purine nucleosidase
MERLILILFGNSDLMRMTHGGARWYRLIAICCISSLTGSASAQSGVTPQSEMGAQRIIIDTDIGGDIDDAYAVGLALQSPEVKILGFTTESGDTGDPTDTMLKARLLSRLLKEIGRSDIPVAVGTEKHLPKKQEFLSQALYAEGGPIDQSYPNAVDFLLEQIRLHPGEITLIAIGPETNIGEVIDRDATTFRRLKRVVIMGGSVYRGYNPYGYLVKDTPNTEYNLSVDVPAAQKLFGSGVPLYVMPLDSTQIKLEELRRGQIFAAGTPLTNILALLTEQWSGGTARTPTLYDAMAVAYALNPQLCPATPLRLRVDDNGNTKPEAGTPNTEVCLRSDSDQFFDFFMPRITSAVHQQSGP